MQILSQAVTVRLLLLEILGDHFYQESQKEDLHQVQLLKIFLAGLKKKTLKKHRAIVGMMCKKYRHN